jgi:hypothetical protein
MMTRADQRRRLRAEVGAVTVAAAAMIGWVGWSSGWHHSLDVGIGVILGATLAAMWLRLWEAARQ